LNVDPGQSNFSDLSLAISLCAGTALTSFLLSSARYGIESVNKSRLLKRVTADADLARFERYFEHLDRSLVGALLVMVLSDCLFGLSLYVLVRNFFPADYGNVAIFVTAALVSLYLVLCGRVLARALVERDAETLLLRILPWLNGIGWILKPLTEPITRFRRNLVRSFGPDDPEERDEAFADEIKAAVEEGEREGIVAEDEATIIENVVEFRDLAVRQVMTPRTDLDWAEADATIYEALKLASDKGHARLPVGAADSDHIIGIFYIRDIVDRIDEFEHLRDQPVRSVVRPAHFVPETKHVVELLKEFKTNKIQIAIVLDEYGGTAGLVTIEDITESLVGEIHDEHDPEEHSQAIELIDPDHALIDGRTRIDDVNQALGIELPEADGVDSIGGLVFSTLGRVPHKGELVHVEGVEIVIADADERRVKKIELKVLNRAAR
jgi:putative hemolysin